MIKELDIKHVKVWILKKGKLSLKVATIDQNRGRVESICDGCSAPCCQGMLKPILNAEEFSSNKFPTHFVDCPEYLKNDGIEVDKVAVLAINNGSPCSYFDSKESRCTIFPNCPSACLSYDCREDRRLEEFVKIREIK